MKQTKTCKTCKNWQRYHEDGCTGYCDAVDREMDGAETFRIDSPDFVSLTTGEDFGCLHHEEKE